MLDTSELHPSQREKIELEHEAAKLFMRCYEQNTGKPIRHIWHNEPSRPDVSCMFEDRRLDLEIAHLYGSEAEAMSILGRSLTDATRNELHALDQEAVDDRLLKALNRILLGKSKKTYSTERVWLVIRNAHPLWSAADVKIQGSHIDVPDDHLFEKIWVLGDMAGRSGIVRLFP